MAETATAALAAILGGTIASIPARAADVSDVSAAIAAVLNRQRDRSALAEIATSTVTPRALRLIAALGAGDTDTVRELRNHVAGVRQYQRLIGALDVTSPYTDLRGIVEQTARAALTVTERVHLLVDGTAFALFDSSEVAEALDAYTNADLVRDRVRAQTVIDACDLDHPLSDVDADRVAGTLVDAGCWQQQIRIETDWFSAPLMAAAVTLGDSALDLRYIGSDAEVAYQFAEQLAAHRQCSTSAWAAFARFVTLDHNNDPRRTGPVFEQLLAHPGDDRRLLSHVLAWLGLPGERLGDLIEQLGLRDVIVLAKLASTAPDVYARLCERNSDDRTIYKPLIAAVKGELEVDWTVISEQVLVNAATQADSRELFEYVVYRLNIVPSTMLRVRSRQLVDTIAAHAASSTSAAIAGWVAQLPARDLLACLNIVAERCDAERRQLPGWCATVLEPAQQAGERRSELLDAAHRTGTVTFAELAARYATAS